MEEGTSVLSWLAGGAWLILFLYTAFRFVRCIRLVPTQSAYIVERLGKYHETLGPGFHVLVPFVDDVAFIKDLKEEAIEVPPQECFTCDNVKVEVDGILYLSVVNPENASYGVTDYKFAAIQLAQTTTRSIIGTLDLDRTFEERDAINSRVVGVLGEVGVAWGLRVHRYEVKNIVTPSTVRDAMERQMGAERERRAVLARAEGQKRSLVNESEAKMTEAINRSEGEMQRRINEAQGRAEEILAIARATSESIVKVGAALSQPGGVDATNLRLTRQYFETLGSVGRSGNSVLLPADLGNVEGLIGRVQLPRPAGRAPATQASAAKTAPSAPAVEPKK